MPNHHGNAPSGIRVDIVGQIQRRRRGGGQEHMRKLTEAFRDCEKKRLDFILKKCLDIILKIA